MPPLVPFTPDTAPKVGVFVEWLYRLPPGLGTLVANQWTQLALSRASEAIDRMNDALSGRSPMPEDEIERRENGREWIGPSGTGFNIYRRTE
jgi:hypothetical protein